MSVTLPETLQFEGVYKPGSYPRCQCFYRKVSFRPPKAGEWYVSGAIPAAYRAPNDLSTSYLVVVPTHFAERESTVVRGDAVQLR